MGQRTKMLAQILGFQGWVPSDSWFEKPDGKRMEPIDGFDMPQGVRFVMRIRRRWAGRCGACGAICRRRHSRCAPRRWADESWAGRPVELQYAPERLRCERCDSTGQEQVPWADAYQRQTKRLQQRLALEAASMPVHHVAALHGLSWATVKRAEHEALARWDGTRTPPRLRHVGVDEKYLGRRGKHPYRYVTIVSNNETGEPLWMGYGRSQETLAGWLKTLSPETKAGIELFVTDMHRAFENAIRADPELAHAELVHDVFHVVKRAGEAMDELRREIFFRAGPELRAVGRGKRWLVLKRWEKCSTEQQANLKQLLRLNGTLARFYQVVEELREALHAPTREDMKDAIAHILVRTEKRRFKAVRSFHESLKRHAPNLYALADHRPATGRVEALNNNWETLVRRGRGYRDLPYMLLKLRFACAHPVRTLRGVERFLSLGLPPPISRFQEAA